MKVLGLIAVLCLCPIVVAVAETAPYVTGQEVKVRAFNRWYFFHFEDLPMSKKDPGCMMYNSPQSIHCSRLPEGWSLHGSSVEGTNDYEVHFEKKTETTIEIEPEDLGHLLLCSLTGVAMICYACIECQTSLAKQKSAVKKSTMKWKIRQLEEKLRDALEACDKPEVNVTHDPAT